MSTARILAIFRKDLAMGPRSPIFLWSLVLPVAMTLLVHGVFGSLFERTPRLGIVDPAGSAVASALAAAPGLDVRRIDDAEELLRRVAAHDLDAGLVLDPGFDEALRAGERPPLRFAVAGESLASDRVVLSVTTLDAIRAVEGRGNPVDVETVTTGSGSALSITQRLLPLVVLLALLVAGVFVTSFSFVQEKEWGTLQAILVAPATLGEVLVAKGLLGLLLAMLMALVTLALNGALLLSQVALLLALLVGATMAVALGLLYGLVSTDTKSLYTLVKSLNLFLVGPVIFYLFPEWPQWIARLFPTYYFLDPIFRVTMTGAGLREVGGTLAVGALLCVLLLGGVAVLVRSTAVRLTVR
jgi:ABC-2 type transport system permease protein